MAVKHVHTLRAAFLVTVARVCGWGVPISGELLLNAGDVCVQRLCLQWQICSCVCAWGAVGAQAAWIMDEFVYELVSWKLTERRQVPLSRCPPIHLYRLCQALLPPLLSLHTTWSREQAFQETAS